MEAKLLLQWTFTQLIKSRDSPLAMGNIGRVIPLLPVGDEVYH
jgi:hypothetical protein